MDKPVQTKQEITRALEHMTRVYQLELNQLLTILYTLARSREIVEIRETLFK